jgi:hypothetical protein
MLVADLRALNAKLDAHGFLGPRATNQVDKFPNKIYGHAIYENGDDEPAKFRIESTADFSTTYLTDVWGVFRCIDNTPTVKMFFSNVPKPITRATYRQLYTGVPGCWVLTANGFELRFSDDSSVPHTDMLKYYPIHPPHATDEPPPKVDDDPPAPIDNAYPNQIEGQAIYANGDGDHTQFKIHSTANYSDTFISDVWGVFRCLNNPSAVQWFFSRVPNPITQAEFNQMYPGRDGPNVLTAHGCSLTFSNKSEQRYD